MMSQRILVTQEEVPPSKEHRFDDHKRTKNFWKVTMQKDIEDFLKQ